jgi:hypothetical protein
MTESEILRERIALRKLEFSYESLEENNAWNELWYWIVSNDTEKSLYKLK